MAKKDGGGGGSRAPRTPAEDLQRHLRQHGLACLRPSWCSLELQARIMGDYDVALSLALMGPERASSEECRPVCTRKPKPCPRGGAERLEERPHLTWADAASGMRPGRVGAGGGSRPRASTQLSHVCTSGPPQNRSWETTKRPLRKTACGFSLCVPRPSGREPK